MGISPQCSGNSPSSPAVADLLRDNQRLRLITRVTGLVVGGISQAEPWNALAAQARAVFEADACIIRALEDAQVRLIACDGVSVEPPLYLPAGEGISGEILASRRPLVIADVTQHPVTAGREMLLPNSHLFGSYAGAPLLVGERVVGILGLYGKQPHAFTEADVEYLQIVAYHLAVTVANDTLYQQVMRQKERMEQQMLRRREAEAAQQQSLRRLQDSLTGTVRAMSSVVEMRDPYTAGHQRRVAALTCAIAHRLALYEGQIDVLRTAGLLHDIGKIVVPAEILCKPGGLMRPEWDIIQTHPQVGHDILKDTALPEEVALVALQHHERLDGSGYPFGLKGDSILPCAQILAVADVVEAMVSDRPYRPGLPMQAALHEITQHRNVRYQAAAVDACLEVLAEHEYELEPVLAQWSGESC